MLPLQITKQIIFLSNKLTSRCYYDFLFVMREQTTLKPIIIDQTTQSNYPNSQKKW